MINFRRFVAVALVLGAIPASHHPANATDRILVFAAASLQTGLERIVAAYHQRHNGRVIVSYASSGALARQIDNGAPASLFISANRRWVGWLQARDKTGGRAGTAFLKNTLVIVRNKRAVNLKKLPLKAIINSLDKNDKFSIGDPTHVPAGIYAKEALQNAGLWQSLAPRLTLMPNVRAAAALIQRGAAPAGIIYRTDALAFTDLEILHRFDAPTVEYFMVPVTKHGKTAAKFVEFAKSRAATAIWRQTGFQTAG